MTNILLLRAPSQDSPDKYETTFENRGHHPYSISVLETGAVNVDALRTTISHGPKKGDFEAVVITSSRAVEVWKEAIDALDNGSEGTGTTIFISLP